MPTPDPNLEQRLRDYARQSEAVGDQAAPLHPADIRAIVAEARARRQAAVPAPPTWARWTETLRRHWLLAASATAVAALLLIILWPARDGRQVLPPVVVTSNPAPIRVVFALSKLRGVEPGDDNTNFLSLPLSLDLDLQTRAVRLAQTNGIVYTGTVSAVETVQAAPLKRRLALTAGGKTAAGKLVELRGTFLFTTDESRAVTAPAGWPIKVVAAILELEPVEAGLAGKKIWLEYPE